ncbi:MAG TPA: MFS transporter [Candidatus Methylacidiphilales bacterium]
MTSRPDHPPARKEIAAWCGYDFAISSFSVIVVTVVFNAYFLNVVCAGLPAGKALSIWGNAALLSHGTAFLLSPFLGAWADFRAAKRTLLIGATIVCVSATFALSFVGAGDIRSAFWLFVVANLAYSLAENFNASFLPELAKPEETGRISGYGWAFGYVGGLVSLFAAFPLVKGGFSPENAANLRHSVLFCSLFFALCSLPALLILRDRSRPRPMHASQIVLAAFVSVRESAVTIWGSPLLRTFFSAFFLYTAGVMTVIAFASPYAISEIGFSGLGVLVLFIVLQVSGSFGAFGFGYVQDKWGSLPTLRLTLVLWVVVVLGAYFCHSIAGFYVVANLAGLAIGSLQSAGRAVIAQLAPHDRRAEYFGFWGLFSKLSAAFGPWVYGQVSAATGSQRYALLGTLAFFLSGLALLGSPALAALSKPNVNAR